MTHTRRRFAVLAGSAALLTAAGAVRALTRSPLVIARGGASGGAAAGTRAAYELAIRDGADFIAADFGPTSDGVLVARREGWTGEDHSLAELKALAGGGLLTFDDLVAIARAGSVRSARVVGVYAGLIRPAHFASMGLALEPLIAAGIRAAGYDSPVAAMFVASDEPEALAALGGLTRARRVRKLSATPPDGFPAIRGYADGVAADTPLILGVGSDRQSAPTALVTDAHAAGLAVHAEAFGQTPRLMNRLFAAGVDGVCADLARPAVKARAEALRSHV